MTTHQPFIFLSTRVVQAASDMIENIGMLQGIRRCSPTHDHQPYQMTDLRKAIAKAQAALSAYDRCLAEGVEEISSEEFTSRAAPDVGRLVDALNDASRDGHRLLVQA